MRIGGIGGPVEGEGWNRGVEKGCCQINEDGLAHVSLLPDFIADLRRQGLRAQDLDALMNSAEGYLQVWERAEARGPSGP